MGDDLADLQVLRRVGLPIAVANAVAEVKAVAAYVTRAAGGHGAVREVVEALLQARGRWPELLERYFSEPAAACRLMPRALVALGRRVVELEARRRGGRRRAARRAVRPGGRACWPMRRAG